MICYKNKYLKYKNKYLKLKKNNSKLKQKIIGGDKILSKDKKKLLEDIKNFVEDKKTNEIFEKIVYDLDEVALSQFYPHIKEQGYIELLDRYAKTIENDQELSFKIITMTEETAISVFNSLKEKFNEKENEKFSKLTNFICKKIKQLIKKQKMEGPFDIVLGIGLGDAVWQYLDPLLKAEEAEELKNAIPSKHAFVISFDYGSFKNRSHAFNDAKMISELKKRYEIPNINFEYNMEQFTSDKIFIHRINIDNKEKTQIHVFEILDLLIKQHHDPFLGKMLNCIINSIGKDSIRKKLYVCGIDMTICYLHRKNFNNVKEIITLDNMRYAHGSLPNVIWEKLGNLKQ